MNFDSVALFYDQLASVVFCGSIKKSQVDSLRFRAPSGKVLLAGGGTGWIIPYVFEGGQVDKLYYLDASAKMIHRAKKNCPAIWRERTVFIHGDESSIPTVGFDTVITNFFLDCLGKRQLEDVLGALDSRLNWGGVWYLTDFRIDSRWYYSIGHYGLVRLMYIFFAQVVKLKNQKLEDYQAMLNIKYPRVLLKKQYAFRCIFSTVFQK